MSADAFLSLERVGVDLGRRTVLDDVSVALPRRCLAALAGPNGAGKTTLLRAVAEVRGAESIEFVVLDETRAVGAVEPRALLDLIEPVLSGASQRVDLDHALTALLARRS